MRIFFCQVARNKEDFKIQFLEDMYSRGKYTLSQREYLWNTRLRGCPKNFKELTFKLIYGFDNHCCLSLMLLVMF